MPNAHPTINTLLRHATVALAHLSTPRLDAEVLLGYTLGTSRSALICDRDEPVNAALCAQFDQLIAARAQGRPIAQLRGTQEFWSLDFQITDAVLVPRGETELLVTLTLALSPPNAPLSIADLGTGSGAIALALATERPQALVLALERSAAALAVARANQARHEIENVALVQGNWLEALGNQRFDFIVANPPYVADEDLVLGEAGLRFEPRAALAAGADGLDALRIIASTALPRLIPDGWLLLEHGATQGSAVRRLLELAGFSTVATACDFAGLERVTYGQRKALEDG